MRTIKRNFLTLIFCLPALAAVGMAQSAAQVEIIPDVVYGHKDGMALTFDVLKPKANANGAAVIFMVSGGWVSAYAPPQRMADQFKDLLDKGFTVIPVRHGSSPKYLIPEIVADVRRAVRYIRFNAKQWGVDANRLGVFGGSAGGHLSLVLGTASDSGDPNAKEEFLKQSDRVASVVAYFPPVDLRPLARGLNENPHLLLDLRMADVIGQRLGPHRSLCHLVLAVAAGRAQLARSLERLDDRRLEHGGRPIGPGHVGEAVDPAVGLDGDAAAVQGTFGRGLGDDQDPVAPRQVGGKCHLGREAIDGRGRRVAGGEQASAAAERQSQAGSQQHGAAVVAGHCSFTPRAAESPSRNCVGFCRRSRTVRLISPTARSMSSIRPPRLGRPVCANPKSPLATISLPVDLMWSAKASDYQPISRTRKKFGWEIGKKASSR